MIIAILFSIALFSGIEIIEQDINETIIEPQWDNQTLIEPLWVNNTNSNESDKAIKCYYYPLSGECFPRE